MRLAWVMSMPGSGQQDDAKALALLESVIGKAPGSSPTRQIATLVHFQIAERLRELRDEQKKTEAVQQKLDALKALERSLIGRDRKPPADSNKTR